MVQQLMILLFIATSYEGKSLVAFRFAELWNEKRALTCVALDKVVK